MKRIFFLLFLLLPAFTHAQVIFTLAGNFSEIPSGDGGPAILAAIGNPYDVKVARSGNVYISDYIGHTIRMIDTAGIIRTVAGNHTIGYSGDGGPATAAAMKFPWGIAVDSAENLYICDIENEVVRKVNTAGIITTFAGNGSYTFSGDGGPATAAGLYNPEAVIADKNGNVYIGDGGNARIRKVDAAGIITTIAGKGIAGYAGDGGPATNAEITGPSGFAFDVAGNLYFSDYGNEVIRKISTKGIITTVAGNGYGGGTGIGAYSGDGGPATAAELSGPSGIVFDKYGNLYIADLQNYIVRKVDTSNIISTICGLPKYGGYSGSGVPAISSLLGGILGIDADTAGNLYLADFGNNLVQKIVMSCLPTAIAGADSICVGGSSAFSDTLSGGTWSLSNSNASVSVGGLVTAAREGLDTLTYTITNICGTNSVSVVVSLQVPESVAAVTGADSVCAGSAVSLSDASAGGAWSVSNMYASVDSRGIVTGISGGSDTLIYTLRNSCGSYRDSAIMKIKPLPPIGVITGTDTVCVSSTVLLTDAFSGGLWNASNGHATISAGSVTGITPGTDTITYSISAGCTAISSKAVYVSVLADAGIITGPTTVCAGAGIALSDTTAGGVWSASNTTAIVRRGFVTGISAGIDTIIYKVINVCGNAEQIKSITINPAIPGAGNITGPSQVCIGDKITLTDTAAGGTWSSSNGNATISGGVVTGITADTSTIVYSVSNACGVGSAIKVITVNSTPVIYKVTGGGSYCAGTEGVFIGLDGSDPAPVVYYTLYDGTTYVTVAPALGSAFDFGAQTDAGVYTVVATNRLTGCTRKMQDSVKVTVLPTGDCNTEVKTAGNNDIPELKVYPNPVNTELNITASHKINAINITNLVGQTVYSEASPGLSTGGKEIMIDVAYLPAGVYFVKINGTETGKFVKQ